MKLTIRLAIVPIKSGKTTSLDPGYPFNSTIYNGRDDISVSPDGSRFNLDCKVFGTLEGGKGYSLHYNGIVRINSDVGAVLSGKSDTMDFKDGYAVNTVYVTLDKDAGESYKWAEASSLVGRGRFFRDSNGLNIEYIVHVVQD